MTNPSQTTRPASPETIRDVMAGGIVKTINGQMSPETLEALAAAGQAYAALVQVVDLEARVRQLEHALHVMTQPQPMKA